MGTLFPPFQLRPGGYQQLGTPAVARDPAKEKQATWTPDCLGSETMAKRLLCQSGPAPTASRPAIETANPEHGLLTGEPDAGEPHVRFGGRGGANQCAIPTPILRHVVRERVFSLCI